MGIPTDGRLFKAALTNLSEDVIIAYTQITCLNFVSINAQMTAQTRPFTWDVTSRLMTARFESSLKLQITQYKINLIKRQYRQKRTSENHQHLINHSFRSFFLRSPHYKQNRP